MASSGGLFVSGTTPATKLGSRYLSLSDQLSKRLLQDKLESSMKFEVDDEDDEDDDNDGDDESYLNESKPLSTAINQQPATRVRSHARSLRAMANPSAVWAHFDLCVEDPLRAQCRICGSVVVRGGANPRQCGTTNLHRHLRVHHGGRLIGRRYHVLQSHTQGIPTQPKPVRLAQQSAIRQQAKNSLRTKSYQSQQQQHEQQQKTVVLKTIPLKVKQVSSAGTGKTSSKSQPAARIPQNTTYPQQPTEVCLRWNSYHSNMQNSFPSLLDSEEFVDVTLACEGRSLKCHKMILSSCSDYLAALLRENPCQHPIILMKDLKFWEVEALVKFMYRGEVNVAHDKLPQLLNAAEALQVKGLAGPCPSQNQKPPNLVPQPKKTQSTPPQVSKPTPETKESKTSASIPSLTSPKRVPKRPHPHPESKDVIKPLTKIRLQRTTSTSSPPAVKLEPLDIPLSPTDMFPDNNDDSSITNYEHLMSMHEDVPGRDEPLDNTDGDIEFCSLSGPSDLNDGDENMEFVPTDFLDQEQDIVEDADGDCSKSSNEETSAKDIELKEVDDEIEDREDGVKNYDDGHGCKAEIT
ncbi:protein tramtrack, beta isoform isoform X1 [Microplitis demolitor]|uniref:protein tramtrack, beta isoform isoform X1 n=2 Tax=Microplitis demolitor TaxID=69319 RepID=UPI0004CDB690|nr:protein tramtrack, beta isoform isoform X1 [Microplitis demolitor]XP_008556267.1 protein tramtrack, beta isoform isoform X1 [Microplitis demolitor]XP_008556274.1 protein tramtrack, beta isoform isoform X1 [Microplitis demolitor]XP_053597809.1 protein tramtrack, beta isoform isoform X1 [Microplitis demolitor]XP_053597817.1 protein tramtrack, beta isoform isoform X1 [Microplitis demolitor]